MSKFSDFWRAKSDPAQRLTQIDMLLKEIDSQMQTKVDPTMWRKMLDDKEKLESERKELVAVCGEFKMQQ